MEPMDPRSDDVERAIDREVDLVMSGVALVAAGGAPSVTVAGLRLSEAVLEVVRPTAAARGVLLDPMWGPDETTRDVRVHRAGTP